MNIKYYLRGLGVGLIVAALILGVHSFRTENGKMTDEQIKARAAQLGMVEENSRLVSSEDDNISAEDLLKSIEAEDTDTENDNATLDSLLPLAKEDAESDISEEEPEADTITEISTEDADMEDLEQRISEVIDDPDLKQANDEADSSEAVEETPVPEETVEASNEVAETTPEPDAAAQTQGKTARLVISSGDSSYKVAAMLTELGLVDGASSYDLWLCNNGYDRYLRTGIYEIPVGSSNETIAKMITGR